MKKAVRLLALTGIVIIGLILAKNVAAKMAVENGVRFVTGLKLNMKHFRIGLLDSTVGIRDLKLYNPKGFEDKVMVDMPEIYVDYMLQPFFKGKIHLPEIRIHLKEFVVVRKADGTLNLDALKVVQNEKKSAEAKRKKEEHGKMPEIQIDEFRLQVEKVVFRDYSKKTTNEQPSVKEFNINLNESYSNITNPYSVVSLIVVKALANTTIASLTNFDLGSLQNSVSDVLASSKKIAVEAALKAKESAAQAAKDAKKMISSAPDDLKETAGALTQKTKGLSKDLAETAESLKDKLKLPFGSKD